MKRSYRAVTPVGEVICDLGDGTAITLPVVLGILKHPTPIELPALLQRPAVANKYTREALRVAPWSVLQRFPREWLCQHLDAARLRPARRAALDFMLHGRLPWRTTPSVADDVST